MFRVARIALTESLVKTQIQGKVGILTLNRPKALNALNTAIIDELCAEVAKMEANPEIGAMIITGEGKAFAAGADIKMMSGMGFSEVFKMNLFSATEIMKTLQTPTIAAVNGFAFGGGCELAMLCDMIIASDKAMFGQPEIKIGTIPGMGGTQRLTHAIGKSKAMEWVLTGDQYTAEEAERAGLVSRVVPADKLMEKSLEIANKIAANSKVTVALAKQAVDQSFEVGLASGLLYEKRAFQSTFATKDQKEGMSAFAEKRAPNFTDS
jgi:enoyl-CoA hydratase/carnithine racemase